MVNCPTLFSSSSSWGVSQAGHQPAVDDGLTGEHPLWLRAVRSESLSQFSVQTKLPNSCRACFQEMLRLRVNTEQLRQGWPYLAPTS